MPEAAELAVLETGIIIAALSVLQQACGTIFLAVLMDARHRMRMPRAHGVGRSVDAHEEHGDRKQKAQ